MEIRTAADVDELLGMPIGAAAVAAALELGLFWAFSDSTRTVRSVAEQFDVPLARCGYWLGALAALGLLEESAGNYGLSPTGRTAILECGSQERWRYLAMEAREASSLAVDLANRLSRRGPVADDPITVKNYVDKLREDPNRARRFTELLYELHGWLGESVADTVDLSGNHKLLDVGGGSGVVSLALLRRNPGLTAVVADLPAVCDAGRSIADRTEEAARISYLPVDFDEQEVPAGFDVILTCDAQFTRGLLAKIARALPNRGRYLLVDRSFDTGPSQRAALALDLFQRSLIDPNHALPTIDQIYERLRAVGFQPSPYVELARPLWKVIEAYKVAGAPD